ncbi:MAG: hemerythrin domain-containing protein, partial [Gammaproteobacteria bacterium]
KRQREYAPGTKIAYDPALVARLKSRHVELTGLYKELVAHERNADLSAVTESLREFGSLLERHRLEENLRLYLYLDKCLAQQPAEGKRVDDIKRDMESMGRRISELVRRYEKEGVNGGNLRMFRDDLEWIGTALDKRIKREESSLYTLYRPPHAYA